MVAALGAGAASSWHPWTDETSQAPGSSAPPTGSATRPTRSRVTRKVDGGEATIVASKSLNQVVVEHRGHARRCPTGKVYEMWLEDADQGMVPVPAG